MNRTSARQVTTPRRGWAAGLMAVVVAFAIGWKAPDLLSAAAGAHPYYATPDKLGLMFESASYQGQVAEPVWARPSLPAVLVRARNQPIEATVKLRVAELFQKLGLSQRALEMYEELINEAKGGPTEAHGLFALQRLFYDSGDYGRTVSSLDLVEKYPQRKAELAAARYLAGQAFLRLQAPEQAIGALEKVDPESDEAPFARYSLGLAYAQEGKFASARKSFEESIAWASERLSVRRVVLVHPDGTREKRIVSKPLYPAEREGLDAVLARSQLALGYLLLENKDYEGAQQSFSAIPAESAYYPEALYAKAWTQVYQSQLVAAIVTLNKLVRGSPSSQLTQEALLLIGSLYVNLKVYDKAIRAYQQAIEIYNGERALAHQVIEEPFLRENFNTLRLYFDPAALNQASDPFDLLQGEDDKQLFRRVVTNVEVRQWFDRQAEISEHLRALRRTGVALEYQAGLIAQKLSRLEGAETELEKKAGERVARLAQQYQLLDDRINNRNQSIDIWQLASRKEADLIRSYNQRLQEISAIESSLNQKVEDAGESLSVEQAQQIEQIRQRATRLRRVTEMQRGEIAWKIISSVDISAGGVRRLGANEQSAGQMARYNKELSKLKAQLDRAKEKFESLSGDVAEARARYRDLQRRSLDLAARHAVLLAESERRYVAVSESVIQAVTEVYRRYDRRMERFVAEAEFGVIGALDQQASQ